MLNPPKQRHSTHRERQHHATSGLSSSAQRTDCQTRSMLAPTAMLLLPIATSLSNGNAAAPSPNVFPQLTESASATPRDSGSFTLSMMAFTFGPATAPNRPPTNATISATPNKLHKRERKEAGGRGCGSEAANSTRKRHNQPHPTHHHTTVHHTSHTYTTPQHISPAQPSPPQWIQSTPTPHLTPPTPTWPAAC